VELGLVWTSGSEIALGWEWSHHEGAYCGGPGDASKGYRKKGRRQNLGHEIGVFQSVGPDGIEGRDRRETARMGLAVGQGAMPGEAQLGSVGSERGVVAVGAKVGENADEGVADGLDYMGEGKVVLGVDEHCLVDGATTRVVVEEERALIHDGESRKT
jgi:hypothetical protein